MLQAACRLATIEATAHRLGVVHVIGDGEFPIQRGRLWDIADVRERLGSTPKWFDPHDPDLAPSWTLKANPGFHQG